LFEASLGKVNKTLSLKQNKKTEGVDQVLEHLPSKQRHWVKSPAPHTCAQTTHLTSPINYEKCILFMKFSLGTSGSRL
jgi:hypothetical protein